MSDLIALCQRVRSELACLGELGGPLLEVVTVVERLGIDRGTDALADPSFALDVLAGGGDPVVIGRVLDFLRTRDGAEPLPGAFSSAVSVAEAVERYEAGARRRRRRRARRP